MNLCAPERAALAEIFSRLLERFGRQRWWPAESPFEVVVGAILTQNTSWQNVEKAIGNLRATGALSVASLGRLGRDRLEELIRPSGFFRQKAARLLAFIRFLENEHGGSLDRLFALPDDRLRATLLERPGIGPETADAIMLYAAHRASFVVDAYTHRILERVGLEPPGSSYEQTRRMFMASLAPDAELFNEFHALIVRLAKEHCRKKSPRCPDCPLRQLCRHGQMKRRD